LLGRDRLSGSASLSSGTGDTKHLTEHLRLNIDECHGRTSNELRGGTITDVVHKGLVVGGDEDCDGSVDIRRNGTLVNGERNTGGHTTDKHLTVEVLVI